MAASIKDSFGIDTKIFLGRSNSFEVTYNDTLIFSMIELKRFPKPGEIADMLKEIREEKEVKQ